jgi:haloacetate dehalogenase
LIGHDRGGRTGHRLALDQPDAVISLTVMDIVPTYAMFMDTNRKVAGSYWHWYFLSQPEPFPERLIGNDPASSTRPALWVGARRGFRISTKRCSPTIAAPGAIPR